MILYLFAFFCFIAFSATSQTQTLVLHPTSDSHIAYHDGFGTEYNNYGGVDSYQAVCQPGAAGGVNSARCLFDFDLSSVPANAVILTATLDLYGRGAVSGSGAASSVGDIGDNESYLERVTSPWQEFTVTWDTKPSTTNLHAVTLPISDSVIQDYLGVNVLPLVEDMIDSAATSFGFGLRLVTEQPTRGLFFCSREYADSSKHATLTITYNSPKAGITSVVKQNLQSCFYPNPCNETGCIHFAIPVSGVLNVYNVTGKDVKSVRLNNTTFVNFSADELGSGLYYYQFSNERLSTAGRFVIN